MRDDPLDTHHAALIEWWYAQGYPPFQCVEDILDTMRVPPPNPDPVPVQLPDVTSIPEVPFHRDRTCRGASPESVGAYLQTKRAQRTLINSRKSAPRRRARRGA